MEAAEKSFMSIPEYLAMEETSEIRHHYSAGQIHAMTGGSLDHNTIVVNMVRHLAPFVQEKGCKLFTSDVRLAIGSQDMFTYPDLMLICGDIERYDNRNDTVTNPRMIIEVLSSSTRDYDRGTKFTAYRTLPSLEEYLLIDQYTFSVERFTKRGKFWQLEDLRAQDAVLTLRTIDLALPLSAIYAETDLMGEG